MDIDLAADLLTGGEEIAEFMFGDRNKRRKVYYLADRGALPTFRMGDILCARRSTLIDHIRQREAEAISSTNTTDK